MHVCGVGGFYRQVITNHVSHLRVTVYHQMSSNSQAPFTEEQLNWLNEKFNRIEKSLNLNPLEVKGKCCVVCLENLNAGWLARTPCMHIFHTECAVAFMRSKLECPICRSSLTHCRKIRVCSPLIKFEQLSK